MKASYVFYFLLILYVLRIVKKNKVETNEQKINFSKLKENVLIPLEKTLGKKINITSGIRSSEHNKEVGGAKESQHVKGEAADINVIGMTSKELFDFIKKSGLPYDQIIEEFGRWVHISFSDKNRFQALKAEKINGKTIYSQS